MLADHLMPHLQGWHWIHQQHHGVENWVKPQKQLSKWNLLVFDSYTILGLVIYCVDGFWWFFVVVSFCRRMGDFWSGKGAGKVFVKILIVKKIYLLYINIYKYSSESIHIRNSWVHQVSSKNIHIEKFADLCDALRTNRLQALRGEVLLKGEVYTRIHWWLEGRWISLFSECLFSGAIFTFRECTLWTPNFEVKFSQTCWKYLSMLPCFAMTWKKASKNTPPSDDLG